MQKTYVYLGPNRPFGTSLMRNAILADDPEKVFPALTPLFAEHKEFKNLFVQADKLAQSRRAITVPGSALYLYNERIKAASDSLKAKEAR